MSDPMDEEGEVEEEEFEQMKMGVDELNEEESRGI